MTIIARAVTLSLFAAALTLTALVVAPSGCAPRLAAVAVAPAVVDAPVVDAPAVAAVVAPAVDTPAVVVAPAAANCQNHSICSCGAHEACAKAANGDTGKLNACHGKAHACAEAGCWRGDNDCLD